MQMDVITVVFDRKTGKELSRRKVGTREIDDDELGDAYCRLLTGKSPAEVAKLMMEQQGREEDAG